MKIALIGINSKFIHKNLAIYSLYSYVKSECVDVDIELMEFSINEPFDKIFYYIVKGNYDVLAFNVYLWSKELILKLISSLRKINRKVKVVVGGPEISREYEDYLDIDYVIIGEGEIPFKHLVSSNFSLKNKVIEERRFIDLNNLPFVYEDVLDELDNKIIYYEGSRGCPFRCSYCLSGGDNNLRLKDPLKIYEEVRALVESGVGQVKFIDRTFNANPDWSIEIVNYLKKLQDFNCNFHFEVSIDKMSDKLLTILEECKPSLFQLEVGIQTTNEKTLKAIGRSNNFSKIDENCKRIIEKGNIHIHTDLIAGLPYEDYESFKKSFNKVFSLKAHMLQVGFLKVIPNTKMFNEASTYGIKYNENPPYEVIETRWLSSDDLLNIKYVEEGVDTFYNTPYFRQTFNFLSGYLDDYFSFFHFIGKRLYFNKNLLSLAGKFDFLYECTLKYLEKDNMLHLKDILKLDWYLNLKDKKKPSLLYEEELKVKDYFSDIKDIKNYKVIKLPFKVICKGIDYEIINFGEDYIYLLNYSDKRSIYNYPLIEMVREERCEI